MRPVAVALLVLILLPVVASAQDEDQVRAFNAAWQAYVAAMESDRSDLRIKAAADVLAKAQELFSESDERIAILTHNYGAALLLGRQNEDAQVQLRKALDLQQQRYGKKSAKLVPIIADLADASGGLTRQGLHMKHYRRALHILEDEYGEESDEYASLAFRAGRNLFELSQSTDGEKYLRQAHDFFVADGGPADRRAGMANGYLGKIRFYRRDYRDAIDYWNAALQSFSGDTPEDRKRRLTFHAFIVGAYESWGKTDLATEHCLAVGRESPARPDQDYVPLFRMAPVYPTMMLAQGIEGHVDFEFTIDENGFVRDAVVVGEVADGRPDLVRARVGTSQEDRSFQNAARAAVERFRYAPRFVDGEAVAVDGVKTRISFRIED